jgi:chorismate synthase
VALGAVARAFLRQALAVEVLSHVVAIGTVRVPAGVIPGRRSALVDKSECAALTPRPPKP